MQEVSAEWKSNINSLNRAQGFVIITINLPDGKYLTIDTRSDHQLKEITANTSYDPVSMTLPTSTIDITLINYNNVYDNFYKTYQNQNLKITVKYGFLLSGDNAEIIKGGTYYISEMRLGDDDLVISGTTKFNDVLDTVCISSDNIDNEVVLFEGEIDANELTEADLNYQTRNIKFNELLNHVSELNIDVISNETFNNYEGAIDVYSDYTLSDLLSYMFNIAQHKITINRDGAINISLDNSYYGIFNEINILDKPLLTIAKKVSTIAAEINSLGTAVEKINNNYHSRSKEESIYIYDDLSFSKNNRLTGFNSTGSINILKITRGIVNKYSITHTDTSDYYTLTGRTHGISVKRSSSGILQATFSNTLDTNKINYTYNSDGQTCDITNRLGKPLNLNKIATYYSNQNIYELEVRADPALDVGDYISVKLPKSNVYSKMLVLENELRFDGSFRGAIKARMIENDFEELTGNTYEDLNAYTHSQLSNYTHYQLSTEDLE